ncbi:hypothetical protein [Streptomyces sp. NPDC097619]|uniref:hypothetical protein n=1 Tax=Streptomyces sp. NPDC097619 TaxID=3157228 RepID=UPI00333420B1
MTPDRLIALLAAHGPLLRESLGPAEREELAGLLRELVAAAEPAPEGASASDPAAAWSAVRRLVRLLRVLPEEHPVALALRGTVRLAGGTSVTAPDPAAVRSLLAALHGGPDLEAAGAGSPADPDPARARLLTAPSLAADRVPGTPADNGLIRLRDPERGYRYPLFQFAAGTVRPLPVVSRINRLLLADRDPWGAADWWLGGNRWLHGVPAELLGSVPDEELDRAARELVEGD